MPHSSSPPASTPRRTRDPERGAALIVALVALVALLGIGAVTVTAVQSDTAASGHDRFQQVALYAAESGVAAGVEVLRASCDGDLFSELVEPDNLDVPLAAGVFGNGVQAGETDNPFDQSANTWYEVYYYNNFSDPGLDDGDDTDGIIAIRAIGHGPNDTSVTLELDVQSNECISYVCAKDFAQQGMNSMNTGIAAICASGALANTQRTVDLSTAGN